MIQGGALARTGEKRGRLREELREWVREGVGSLAV